MSKPNNKPAMPKPKAFYKDKNVQLFVTQQAHQIVSFRAVFLGDIIVEVKVHRNEILKAFKKFENHKLIKNL